MSEEFNFEVKIIASFTNFETKEIIARTIEKTKLKVVKWINLSNEKENLNEEVSHEILIRDKKSSEQSISPNGFVVYKILNE